MGKIIGGCDCEVIHAQAVENVKRALPPEGELAALADFFKVFGNSTRIRIMCALDCGELCVCDIAAILNMAKSAISHQLRLLKDNKLVKARREGKEVYYSLSDEHVKEIIEKAVEHLEEE